jgi:rare lipoprotein A
MMHARVLFLSLVLLLSACATRAPVSSSTSSTSSKTPTPTPTSTSTAKDGQGSTVKIDGKTALILPKANSGQGGYYQDDGPADVIPENLESTVDPIPRKETLVRGTNKSYVVKGKTYTPINDDDTPFVQRGLATWYGKKFHGRRTASGEVYDMYKITAAHPTLPIPSYARVTNLVNGKQIIVRINDRGPFHSDRIIDLSFTAALKLDILSKGSSQLEVERLLPRDIAAMAENRANQKQDKPIIAITNNEVGLTSNGKASEKVSESDLDKHDPLGQFLMQREAGVASSMLEQSKLTNKTETIVQPTSQQTMLTARQKEASAGFYVQFGAYGILANAQANLTALQKRLGANANVEIIQQGRLYRLQSGPYASREAALRLANSAAGELAPLVIQR